MATEPEYPDTEVPQEDSSYYYPEDRRNWDSDTIKNLISTDEIIKDVELKLRGIRENEKGELVNSGEPKMNSHGVSTVISIISAISNKNTHLTNFDKNYEKGIIRDLNYKLNRILLKRKKEFEIKDILEINMIVFPLIVASIRRGVDESDKAFLRGSFHHGSTMGNMPQRSGLFGFLKRK